MYRNCETAVIAGSIITTVYCVVLGIIVLTAILLFIKVDDDTISDRIIEFGIALLVVLLVWGYGISRFFVFKHYINEEIYEVYEGEFKIINNSHKDTIVLDGDERLWAYTEDEDGTYYGKVWYIDFGLSEYVTAYEIQKP
ncbi:MAG: hypothetical protein E7652_03465 [Ruminococcaceae bacterium]|nr:hypothetical protein [Oscillospiraceae bacterium]